MAVNVRRGDNIPDVSEYSHHNEEAEQIWWLENRYDMEHADEVLSDGWEDENCDYQDEEDLCTGDSTTCPVDHSDDPEGLCPEER